MIARKAPSPERPTYLDHPTFVALETKLEQVGAEFFWNATHLLVMGLRVRHEQAMADPMGAAVLIAARVSRLYPTTRRPALGSVGDMPERRTDMPERRIDIRYGKDITELSG